MRAGSLFSGAAGLDMAVSAVFGAEVIWHCEIDPAASKVLAHHYPSIPNLGDITAVDWAEVPSVDVLCLGFPCQDVSGAGRRAGIREGTRSGLWVVAVDAIEALRPRWVVIENVRGLLSARAHRLEEDAADHLESGAAVVGDRAERLVLRAAGAVCGDLADAGYDCCWFTQAASEVGAPHKRERVFFLAWDRTSPHTGHDARRAQRWLQHQIEASGSGESGAADRGASWEGGGRADASVTLLHTPAARDASGLPPHPAYTSLVTDVYQIAGRELTGIHAAKNGQPEDDAALLPTPVTTDAKSAGRHSTTTGVMNPGTSLTDAVRLLPTPNSQDGNGGKSPRGGSNTHNSGTKRQVPLTDLPALLPTPTAGDGEGGKISGRNGTQINLKGIVQALAGDTENLPDCPELQRLLPTPAASDGEGGKISRSGDRKGELLLGGVAREITETALLQTPQARDAKGAPGAGFNEGNLHSQLIELGAQQLLPTPSASDGGGGGPSNPDSRRSNNHHLQLTDMATRPDMWGRYAAAIHRWERITRPAPAPTEPNRNGRPRLSAAFSEWMMGWPEGWVTDPAIGLKRGDQLKIAGNGVVPHQAAAALRFLLTIAATEVAA